MSRRRRDGRRWSVVITEHPTKPVVLLRGWNVGTVLEEAGFKPLWSHTGHGWVLDAARLADAVAWLEHRGVRCRFTDDDGDDDDAA